MPVPLPGGGHPGIERLSVQAPVARAEVEEWPVAARRLGKAMGGRAVLRRLDLNVAAGDTLAVIGENGAGKTTLLRLLSGALEPDFGTVSWFGQTVRSAAVRRRIGVMGHRTFLYDGLTAKENLVHWGRLYRVPRPAERADALLAWCGLGRAAHRPAAQLSRGMAQRLSLARALLAEPDLLLLDEPETGLDADGRLLLGRTLAAHAGRGGAAVVASHDLAFLAGVAPHALCLGRGGAALLAEPGPQGEGWAAALRRRAAP
jgi:heme exporter protein A